MKRILFLLLLTFSIFCGVFTLTKSKVYATANKTVTKPFVCTIGHDYSYLLEYDGYEIISKAVDFYNVGTYYVTYLNKDTKETVSKRIDVINESSLLDNGYYRSNQTNLYTNDYQLIDSFTYEGITYLLEVEQQNEKHNLILSKVENNSVVYTKVVKQNIEATFNKILVDDEGIYILGTIYKEGYSIDLYCLNIDFSFNIVFENTIGGSGIETLTDGIIYGDYIYVVGNTTSSGGYFNGTRKKEDSFVMKLSKDLFNVIKTSVSTLSNINTYTHITIKDDFIYLFEQTSNTETVSYTSKVYTLDLNVSAAQPFVNSHALTPNKLVSKEEGVFLICYQYNYLLDNYASRVYLINDDATTSLYYDYTNCEDENLRIKDINFNSSQMIVLTYDFHFNKTKLIIKDLFTKEISTLSIDSKEPLEFINANTYLSLDYKIIDYLFIKYNDANDLLINNKYVELSSKSVLNNDQNIFGNYEDIYIYETEDVLLASIKERYIPIDVSVINNETFDNNLVLTFNGTGYLNDKQIESGYVVNKTGIYQLEVYGKNNERKVYHFDVANLSDKEVELKEVTKVINVEENLNNVNNEMTLLYGEHLNNEVTKTYYFFLLLIPLVLLAVSLVLIFRRKHEK